MGFSTTDVLVSVPNAELHKVVNNVQTLLQHGAFSVSISTPAADSTEEGLVQAAVGGIAWPLGKHLPALKAAEGIYSFALAHTKAKYLIVVLPKGEGSQHRVHTHACIHACSSSFPQGTGSISSKTLCVLLLIHAAQPDGLT